MQNVIEFLKENSAGFLAIVENGKPKVRPFQYFHFPNDRQLIFSFFLPSYWTVGYGCAGYKNFHLRNCFVIQLAEEYMPLNGS